MISKNSRRATNPVESLKQLNVTGAKGVDLSKTSVSLDTVSQLKNLDVEPDGGLILRKPLVLLKTFPTYKESFPVKVFYLYDKLYKLYVYNVPNPADGSVETAVSIQNNAGETFPIIFRYTAWDTGAEVERVAYNERNADGSENNSGTGGYYVCSEFNLANAYAVNLNTATILTNCTVNADGVPELFKGTANGVADSNVLVDTSLYDSRDLQALPRTLQIAKSTAMQTAFPEFYFRIVSPEITDFESSSSGALIINANLAADNPYALRDAYSAVMPTVKAVALYLPTYSDELNKRKFHSAYSDVTSFDKSYVKSVAMYNTAAIDDMLANFRFTFENYTVENPLKFPVFQSMYNEGFSLRIHWDRYYEYGLLGLSDPYRTESLTGKGLCLSLIKDIKIRFRLLDTIIAYGPRDYPQYVHESVTLKANTVQNLKDYCCGDLFYMLPHHNFSTDSTYGIYNLKSTDIAIPIQCSDWTVPCSYGEALSRVHLACDRWDRGDYVNLTEPYTFTPHYFQDGTFYNHSAMNVRIHPTSMEVSATLYTIDGRSATYTVRKENFNNDF